MRSLLTLIAVAAVASVGCAHASPPAGVQVAAMPIVAVGPQFDSTHVYVAPGDLDAFVNSFIATFGGKASKASLTNVLPVPSTTEFRITNPP